MLTGEALAKGVHQKAFAIQIIARGVDIPKDLAPDLRLLLMGLLTRDHAERWRWPQVEAWLEGSPQEPPPEWQEPPIAEEKTTILLGEKRFSSPELFALQAAEAENWDKASALLRRGGLATWLDSLAGRFPDNPRRQRAADAIF